MSETAEDVARDLAQYLRERADGANDEAVLVGLFERLKVADASNSMDALVCAVWIVPLLIGALEMLPEEVETGRKQPRMVVTEALALAGRAVQALEASTGANARDFTGDPITGHVYH